MRKLLALALLPLFGSLPAAAAPERASLSIEIGPVAGAPSAKKTVTIEPAASRRAKIFDIQDGREHHVRGVPLADLVILAGLPKHADTAVFVYADGMNIPVRLRDKREVQAVFIALEHGDPLDHFERTYHLFDRPELTCPKVVYQRRHDKYSIWVYPTELRAIRFVSWAAYQAELAQPTRRFPDRSGWDLYVRHCQSCHGLGGQGAKRGPDLLAATDAYRRIPPLLATDRSQHPSLHEKVKGFTEGTMPVLDHISNQEIAALWRWLHAIHAGATR